MPYPTIWCSCPTICVFPAFSSATAFLKRIPFFAPMPFPTMIATGVASPSAHGQLMTSTEIPRANAKPTSFPAISQTIMVITAMVITVGTNTPDTLSAIFAIGALRQMISQSIPQFLNSIITIVSVFVSMLLLNIPLTINEREIKSFFVIPHESQKRSNFLPISGETATVELRGVLKYIFIVI